MKRFAESIDASTLLERQRPRVEPLKDVSSWFVDEKLELDFGDDVGRPSDRILLKKEYITQFLANGWVIDAVMARGYGGIWKSVSKTVQSEIGSSSSKSFGKSEGAASGESSSSGSTKESRDSRSSATTSQSGNSTSTTKSVTSSMTPKEEDIPFVDRYSMSSTNSTTTASSNESTNTSSTDESESSAESESSGRESSSESRSTEDVQDTGTVSTGETETVTEGNPFWYSYQHVRLRRRRLQPERVLQSMMDSFTDAYNSGREIDDERYGEIVSLYAVALGQNERDGRFMLENAVDVGGAIDAAWREIEKTVRRAESAALRVSESSYADAVADVNRQFDALVSQKRAEMISAGMYNNTVWASVEAGIERQRAAALVKAKSEGGQIAVSAQATAANTASSAYANLVAAKQQYANALDQRRLTVVELRNSVLKWMLDFAGSREEVYPELEEISAMAQQMGFSVGAAGNVI